MKNGKLENNLSVLRTERKWTQNQVALMLSVSRQTINAIEANKYNPSLRLAYRLALLFNKDITDVFCYSPNENEGEDNA